MTKRNALERARRQAVQRRDQYAVQDLMKRKSEKQPLDENLHVPCFKKTLCKIIVKLIIHGDLYLLMILSSYYDGLFRYDIQNKHTIT